VDETFGLGIGTQWDALPGRRWSPYLLTTGGFMHSRLAWSRAGNTEPDETLGTWGPFLGYGAGMRVQLWRIESFVEWRRQHLWHTLVSSRVAPLSLGIRY
jgi:hypothetical protein